MGRIFLWLIGGLEGLNIVPTIVQTGDEPVINLMIRRGPVRDVRKNSYQLNGIKNIVIETVSVNL